MFVHDRFFVFNKRSLIAAAQNRTIGCQRKITNSAIVSTDQMFYCYLKRSIFSPLCKLSMYEYVYEYLKNENFHTIPIIIFQKENLYKHFTYCFILPIVSYYHQTLN